MLRLHQTFGAHAGRVVEVDRDVIRFGRLQSCEFAFDPHADLDASGTHAELRREGASWYLRDLGSRNGTLLDGRPIQRHEVRSGEEFEFGAGGPRVRVELLGAVSARGMATVPATPLDAGETAGSTFPASPAASPSAFPRSAFPAAPPPSAHPALAPANAFVQPNAGAPRAHDTAFIRSVADDVVARRWRVVAFTLGVVLTLFVLVLCGVSGLLVLLWNQAYPR